MKKVLLMYLGISYLACPIFILKSIVTRDRLNRSVVWVRCRKERDFSWSPIVLRILCTLFFISQKCQPLYLPSCINTCVVVCIAELNALSRVERAIGGLMFVLCLSSRPVLSSEPSHSVRNPVTQPRTETGPQLRYNIWSFTDC